MLFRVGSASFELVFLNPLLYTLLSLMLLLIALPLTILGVITTVFALGILLLRSLFVYYELPLALVTAWLSPPIVETAPRRRRAPSKAASRGVPSPSQRYVYDIVDSDLPETEVSPNQMSHRSRQSDFIKVTETTDKDGDEEDAESDFSDEEPLSIFSREHRLSLTEDTTARERWGFDLVDLHRSPAQSRARTPYVAQEEVDYFSSQPTITPPTSTGDDIDSGKHHVRRKSGSGSSISSVTSLGLMMTVKEVEE